MKLSILLLPLISADLIGFNRYRNNFVQHVGGRIKPKSNSSDYLRLQMILDKMAKGDAKSFLFAKSMMANMHNHKISTKIGNRRLNNYLKRLK